MINSLFNKIPLIIQDTSLVDGDMGMLWMLLSKLQSTHGQYILLVFNRVALLKFFKGLLNFLASNSKLGVSW